MSQENVEIVRNFYEDLGAHMWEASPDLFDPEFALDLTDSYPDFGVIRGLEAAETALRGYVETFEDFHVELKEVIHADERLVVTAARDGGRLKGSDAEVWNDFFHVWTFRDGKVTRRSSHSNRSQALEAAVGVGDVAGERDGLSFGRDEMPRPEMAPSGIYARGESPSGTSNQKQKDSGAWPEPSCQL